MPHQYDKGPLNNNKNDKVVLSCPECGKKLRLPVYEDKKLRVTCPNPKCKKEFLFDCKKYRARQKLILLGTIIACFIILSVVIIAPIFLLDKGNVFITEVQNEYESQFEKMQDEFIKEKISIKESYDSEIKKIDVGTLKTRAAEHYENTWRSERVITVNMPLLQGKEHS